jgi:hypothetical protein
MVKGVAPLKEKTMGFKVRSRVNGNHALILISGTLASTFIFLLAILCVSRSLTFFWDDYEVLKLIAVRPFEQVFMNGVGHFGPMWRIFFMIQVFLFGASFYLYIFSSAILVAIGFWGFAYSFRPLMKNYFWLVIPFSVIFFTSLGVLQQVPIAVGSEFTLAFAFAGAASYVYSRSLRFKWPTILLVASGLSLNGTFPIYYSMFAAVVVTFYAYNQTNLSIKKVSFVVFGGLSLTLVWAGIAAILGSLNPSPYYDSSSSENVVRIESQSVLEQLFDFGRTVFTLVLTWLAGPIIPGATAAPDSISRILFFFALHVGLVFVIFMAIATALVVLLRRHREDEFRRALAVVLAWLLPTFIAAVILTYTRPDSLITDRYAIIWVPTVLFFYLAIALLLTSLRRKLFARIVGFVGIALLSLSAIFGLMRLPLTIIAAADLDRPRTSLSLSQHKLMSECLNSQVVTPLSEISPRLSGEDFCAVSRFLYTKTLPALLP